MAEKITFEDQTQTLKSRPRPEVIRQAAQHPGGLPLPPSKQTTVPSSMQLFESETSSIPTISVVSSNSGKSSMPTDLFGLSEFKILTTSQLKTTIGQSCAEFSSIKSPTHLPRISNLMVPNLLGSFSARAGGKKQTSLPKPPDFKSVLDLKSRDEFVSDVKDSNPKILVKRPIDLSLFGPDESAVKHSSDRVSIDKTGVHKFKNPNPSSDLNKSNTVGEVSDVDGKSAKPVKPSTVESMSESHSYATSSVQGASTSFQLPATSANVESPEPQDFNLGAKRSSDPTPTMSQPEPFTEMKRTSESMPTISQHRVIHKKSTSIIRDKVKSVMRRLGFKKFGKEVEEESTGLMFEREDMENEHRSETRPEDDKAKPFPTATYNYFLAIDPILPMREVESKCRIVGNVPYDSPTESVISDSSKSSSSKSASFVTSPDETYVEESTSKSCPVTPSAEQTSGSTPMSLSIERPSSKSSPVSLDIGQRSKSSPGEDYASKSNPVSPSIERESKTNHE